MLCKYYEIIVEQQHWYERPKRSWCNSCYQDYYIRKENFLGSISLSWVGQEKYNYFDCKLARAPYDPSVKLFKSTWYGVRQKMWASLAT